MFIGVGVVCVCRVLCVYRAFVGVIAGVCARVYRLGSEVFVGKVWGVWFSVV